MNKKRCRTDHRDGQYFPQYKAFWGWKDFKDKNKNSIHFELIKEALYHIELYKKGKIGTISNDHVTKKDNKQS